MNEYSDLLSKQYDATRDLSSLERKNNNPTERSDIRSIPTGCPVHLRPEQHFQHEALASGRLARA